MLGAGVFYGPNYIGSNRFDDKDLFYVRGPAIGYNFLAMGRMKVSLANRYQIYGGRSVKDNDKLKGLEDIDPGFDVGLVASLDLSPWSRGLSVFKDVTHAHGGAIIDFDADRELALTDKLHAEVGAKFVWGDRKIKQTYFGITSAQSAARSLSERV